MRVVIIDDDEGILYLMRDALESENYQVSAFQNGTEAIQGLARTNCSLVITDLGMPEVDGWDVLRWCSEQMPDVPVIIMTGCEANASIDRLYPSNAPLKLLKPFTVQQLLDLVRNAKSAESRR